jgi:outer membrane protein assembly factor BamD (BamD/ComL family)
MKIRLVCAPAALFAAAALFVLSAAGCASRPVTAPDDITAEELIQRGQEASDRYNYDQALQYYRLVLDRFPYNIDMVCAAEYEIAFINYKQKNYAEARVQFNTLLLRYQSPDAELLPPQFKRLCEIVLERMGDAGQAAAEQ